MKPYKVGNICYMTYRYSVLYFLNLSLKHFFLPQKTAIFVKISKFKTVIVPCLNVSRMPNLRTSQSKIEDIVHCKCIRCKIIKNFAKMIWALNVSNDPSPLLCVSTGKQRSDRSAPTPFYVHCSASIC